MGRRAKETIWDELDRFIGSIEDEIRSDNPDQVTIDFWLFKIKRRVDILHSKLDPNFKMYKKTKEQDDLYKLYDKNVLI